MHRLLVGLNSLFLFSSIALAQDLSGRDTITFFGGSDLDYWREGARPMQQPLVVRPGSTATPGAQPNTTNKGSIRARDAEPFDWRAYENPNNEVFWDDGGDWIPARPFREAAANPTADNVAKYLSWMQRKMDVSAKFERELKKQTTAPVQKKNDVDDKINWNKMNVVYFYQSSCPHCQRSVSVVEDLKTKGAHVIPVQLDYKTNPPLHENSTPYEGELARNYKVNGTPMWVVSYGGRTRVLIGEKGVDEIAGP